MNALAKIDYEKLLDFVLLREKKDGGFAAFPSLPHTIQDTFHAIDTLDIICRKCKKKGLPDSIRGQKTKTYIRDALTNESTGSLKLRYFLARICHLLKINIEIVITGLDETSGQPGDYEYEFYKKYFKYRPGAGGININNLFWNNRPTCKNILFALKTISEPDLPYAGVDDPVQWLRRCQNPDGGFGFYPGTTSYIENCHYCLESLSILKHAPFDLKQAENFIVWSQTSSGGFSRNLKAAPFLDASWHAVKALDALQRLQGSVLMPDELVSVQKRSFRHS